MSYEPIPTDIWNEMNGNTAKVSFSPEFTGYSPGTLVKVKDTSGEKHRSNTATTISGADGANVMRFKVIVTNKILGNSERIMSLEEIKRFNCVAYQLALKSKNNNGEQFSSGMWSVSVCTITSR